MKRIRKIIFKIKNFFKIKYRIIEWTNKKYTPQYGYITPFGMEWHNCQSFNWGEQDINLGWRIDNIQWFNVIFEEKSMAVEYLKNVYNWDYRREKILNNL